ncbi:GNAT family N-acetyltransferase [Actinoplanes sp. NPDC051411]|uniref:GNAT family N-acetyltransferase n=1 Tax=Actinoplanes sp. NPDC051411 TaxID=3155522 RepID=UPI00342B887C
MPEIRPYRPVDRDALYDICVRTADAGADARGRYSSDDLMGDLFAVSYAHLEPDMAFVADDGHGRAVGYIVGTKDTPAFVRRFATEWVPLVAGKYDAQGEKDRDMLQLLHHPEHMLVAELADYPAHLHMNLVPGFQRQGHGRRLMEAFLAAANGAGARRVHLGMLTVNVKARAFYDRVGFTELQVKDPGPLTYLGRAT